MLLKTIAIARPFLKKIRVYAWFSPWEILEVTTLLSCITMLLVYIKNFGSFSRIQNINDENL